jgi:3-hydroxyacyl-CoA dehydrogenase
VNALVSCRLEGHVAIVTVNNPPVNALGPALADAIIASVRSVEQDESAAGLVLAGAGRTFIAGADIREFQKLTRGAEERGPGLHPLMYALEDCSKPVICAMHGTILGGGLEVAMACHYRVASREAVVGQPEVKLGLIPGAGGTQRLPRLAGVAVALEMCAEGEPMKAADALRNGIVDSLAGEDLLGAAVEFVLRLLDSSKPPRRTRELAVAPDSSHASLFQAARQQVRRKQRGRVAPLKAVEAVEAATRLPFEQGIQREAELFRDCLFSDQSRALIHVFFGEREVARVPGLPSKAPDRRIRKAAVIGAGTMGSGIAAAYANAGVPVLLTDVSRECLERGLETIRSNYRNSVQKGRITSGDADTCLDLIRPVTGYSGLEEADVVVEAVFENLQLKRQVFSELDRACRPDAMLATNTSTLDIDSIAAATSRPGRVVGHHFFAPANVMRLLEIVRGRETSGDVIAWSLALARRLDKVGVVVGNCRGFVGNRMYRQYQREAQFLLEEGASVEQVDLALYNFGMAMGPFAAADLSGLDVGWRIRKEHADSEPVVARRTLVADRLCEMGRFGQKTGAGWYRYEGGNRKPIPDPEVDRLVDDCSRAAGINRRAIAPDAIVERTVYALVNEGAKILEEGIALRPVDIDMVYVYGYGFPAHRGGPMWHADTVGLAAVHERVAGYYREFGDHWRPAPLLKRLAESGSRFYDLERPAGTAASKP